MKGTRLSMLSIALLAFTPASGSQDIQKMANEGMAYSRLVAAETVPAVTHGQCYSAQGVWLERDNADKQGGPYWYQKLSTEELVRMASISSACATEVIGHANPNATSVGAFVARSSEFRAELLFRLESILHDHGLIETYLLQPHG